MSDTNENKASVKEKWEEIKNLVREEGEVSNVAYSTWIEPMECYSEDDDTVVILLPSDKGQIISHLEKKYKDFFIISIAQVMDKEYNVVFKLKKDDYNETVEVNEKDEMESIYKKANLSLKYTFDNFIVGNNNNFAQQACLAVAEAPGEEFNPLFLYGGSGLGKTHLMNSIGRYILDHNPEAKVLYVNSETFTNEVIESIRSTKDSQLKINKMREKYRNVDVLLIDDIQFIIGKDATQEEFFHTFNHLYEAGKAIIISSDKHPKQMEILDERFRSRFQWGLQADIQPPSYETRCAILYKLAEPYGNKVPEEVIKYIAENIKSNIRELEGAFNKLLALDKLINHKPITLEEAENVLKDMIYPDQPKIITPTIIMQVVADHYGIKKDNILSSNRKVEYALPRQVFMYLCSELVDMPFTTIAKVLDKKDHTTISYGVKKIEEKINTDQNFAEQIEIIKKKITPQ